MALAVKNATEATPESPFERLAISSLAGLAYVVGSLALVFYAIPWIWGELFPLERPLLNPFVSGAVMIVLMVAAVVGLSYLGMRLVNFDPPHGLRGGIFVAGLGVVLILTATWIIGRILEAILSHWEGTQTIGG